MQFLIISSSTPKKPQLDPIDTYNPQICYVW